MTMLNNQRLLNIITVGLLLFVTAPTIAQSTSNSSAQNDKIITRVLFKPPSKDKKPERTDTAGSRHGKQCHQDTNPVNLVNSSSTQSFIMPLVPNSNFGLTIAERPILSIYLPPTSARKLVLSIREEGTTHHSQTFVPITGSPGIVILQPDPDSPPLEVGKTYQWAVVLVCGERPSPNDPAFTSWIRRVAPLQGTNKGTALELAAWYGQQGIWYDALNSLLEMRRSQPENQDLIAIWAEFLSSGGLKAIATEPLQF